MLTKHKKKKKLRFFFAVKKPLFFNGYLTPVTSVTKNVTLDKKSLGVQLVPAPRKDVTGTEVRVIMGILTSVPNVF